MKLMQAIWSKNDTNTSIAPIELVQTVKFLNPTFKGYSQQDSQEFLLCLLDQLHEELKRVQTNLPTINRASGDLTKTSQNGVDDDLNMNISSQSDSDSFKSCGSSPSSENNFLSNYETTINDEGPTILFSNEREKHRSYSIGSMSDADHQDSKSAENELILNPNNLGIKLNQKKKKQNEDEDNEADKQKTKQQHKLVNKKDKKVYSSIISDIFDGKMIGQVQCIGCESISNTIETFQDLSLPIPTKEYLQVIPFFFFLLNFNK